MLHSTPEENQRVVLLTLKFTTELKRLQGRNEFQILLVPLVSPCAY